MRQTVDILDSTPLYILYTEKPAFQSLRIKDKLFFQKLFPLLLFSPSNEFSHKYLAEACKEDDAKGPIPESTLQKRLRRLASAKLIHKWAEREKVDDKWITTHDHIELEPATFAFVRAEHLQARIDSARQEALNNGVYLDKVAVEEIQASVEASAQGFSEEEETLEERFRRMINEQ